MIRGELQFTSPKEAVRGHRTETPTIVMRLRGWTCLRRTSTSQTGPADLPHPVRWWDFGLCSSRRGHS